MTSQRCGRCRRDRNEAMRASESSAACAIPAHRGCAPRALRRPPAGARAVHLAEPDPPSRIVRLHLARTVTGEVDAFSRQLVLNLLRNAVDARRRARRQARDLAVVTDCTTAAPSRCGYATAASVYRTPLRISSVSPKETSSSSAVDSRSSSGARGSLCARNTTRRHGLLSRCRACNGTLCSDCRGEPDATHEPSRHVPGDPAPSRVSRGTRRRPCDAGGGERSTFESERWAPVGRSGAHNARLLRSRSRLPMHRPCGSPTMPPRRALRRGLDLGVRAAPAPTTTRARVPFDRRRLRRMERGGAVRRVWVRRDRRARRTRPSSRGPAARRTADTFRRSGGRFIPPRRPLAAASALHLRPSAQDIELFPTSRRPGATPGVLQPG